MNKEIKEILYEMGLIVNYNKTPIYFSQNQIKLLSDFINNLQAQLQQKENVIKEAREYVESYSVFDEDDVSYFVKAVPSELLNILDKEMVINENTNV